MPTRKLVVMPVRLLLLLLLRFHSYPDRSTRAGGRGKRLTRCHEIAGANLLDLVGFPAWRIMELLSCCLMELLSCLDCSERFATLPLNRKYRLTGPDRPTFL